VQTAAYSVKAFPRKKWRKPRTVSTTTRECSGGRSPARVGGTSALPLGALGCAWMARNRSCRPSGASLYFNTGLPPLTRWATLFRPWRGWIKRIEKTHPYTTKDGAPAKATSRARPRDPQRQRQEQDQETRKGNVKSKAKRPAKATSRARPRDPQRQRQERGQETRKSNVKSKTKRPVKATSRARPRDPQRQLLNQEGFIARRASDGEPYFAALSSQAVVGTVIRLRGVDPWPATSLLPPLPACSERKRRVSCVTHNA